MIRALRRTSCGALSAYRANVTTRSTSEVGIFRQFAKGRSLAASAASSHSRPGKRGTLLGAGLLISATGASVLYFHNHFGGTTGWLRAISFYSFAIPKYVQYRYHLFRQSSNPEWDDLHRDTSLGALGKILSLQGFYVKCGQMCAANIGNAFPPIWQDTMSVLQDQVPPQHFSLIRATVDAELGLEATFSSFDATPIGSASIGQVHRAVLRNGGIPVVVKVQYPHVERLLRGDVRTVKFFCQVAQPVHVPGLEEIEHQFQTEFDYRREAQALDMVRTNLEKAGLSGRGRPCVVPKPYLEYCTQRVLVMEELNGDKLAVELQKDIQRQAKRAAMTVQEFLATHRSDKERTKKELDIYIAIENSRRRASNAWNRLHNMTLGWLPGNSFRAYPDRSVLPLNHAQIVDDLIYIHGHEVLVNGFFNGDPHPGKYLEASLLRF
jgi:aarF domain-containing kinase